MEKNEQNTVSEENFTYSISSLVVGNLMANEDDIHSLVSFFNVDPTKLDKENTPLPYQFIFHKEKVTFEEDGKQKYGVHYENVFCPEMYFVATTEEKYVDKLYDSGCLLNEDLLPLSFFTEQELRDDSVTQERLLQCLLALNYQMGIYNAIGQDVPPYQYKI